jgi:uncharacterized protein (TIGR01777 family)
LKNAVLITGASGLIGRRLTATLLQKGCRVSHLGRSSRTGEIPAYRWDPDRGSIDPRAFDGVDTLVHLAGAGIGDKRWTSARKREILESRVRSTALLVDFLRTHEHGVKTVIAASAIGYYGFGDGDTEFTEESAAGSDFLASVVVRWEQETERFKSLGLRLVKPRIGVVLSREGGALKEIVRPIQWGIGAPLGDGMQVMSWIHIDDLCGFMAYAMEHPHISGVYNAVAPYPVTNKALTYEIARQLKRSILLPPVPGFVLRLMLGQMADLVTKGSHVTGSRTATCGFQFRFPELSDALSDQLRKRA